jgi:hypothetical protein
MADYIFQKEIPNTLVRRPDQDGFSYLKNAVSFLISSEKRSEAGYREYLR